MAKKAAKEESLKDLTVQELEARLQESQEKSFKLKYQHAANPIKNPMEIRTARRQIAKVLTFLHQKQKVTIGPMRHSADGLATKATGRKEAS